MSDRLALTFPDELVEAIADRVAAKLAGRLTPEPSPWLNVEQAAEYLACPPSRVYDLVSLKRIEPRRDGRRLVFRCSDLDDYLETDNTRKTR